MIKFFRLPGCDFATRKDETTPIRALVWMPALRNYLLSSFAIGVSLGAGISHGFSHGRGLVTSVEVTRAEYERIELQMPRAEVEAILGRGVEVDQSALATTFEWKNLDGSLMTATFRKGNVIQKSQRDL